MVHVLSICGARVDSGWLLGLHSLYGESSSRREFRTVVDLVRHIKADCGLLISEKPNVSIREHRVALVHHDIVDLPSRETLMTGTFWLSRNGASIGGLKVVTEQGWFAARPSGTEDVCIHYPESFKGKEHLRRIQDVAHALFGKVLTAGR